MISPKDLIFLADEGVTSTFHFETSMDSAIYNRFKPKDTTTPQVPSITIEF